MSVSSFPRAEHIAMLRRKIEEGLRERGLPLEVAERGLNQMKCQYRFGLRRRPCEKPPSSTPPESNPESIHPSTNESMNDSSNDWAELPWAELAIHFQIAQRLEEGRGDAELDRILESFFSRHFPEFPVSQDGG